MENKNKKIYEYTSIRFFWALIVVINHVYVLCNSYFNFNLPIFIRLDNGGMAVSCFLIMSGFLIKMRHGTEENEKKLLHISGIRYAIHALKRSYVIYVVSFLPWFLTYVVSGIRNSDYQEIASLIIDFFANILMIQSWVPGVFRCFNNVSWYFSIITALYILAPFLLYMDKHIVKQKIRIIIVALLLIAIYVMGDLFGYIFYYSIPLRLAQFYLGMCVFNLLPDKLNLSMSKIKVLGILSLIVQILVWLLIESALLSSMAAVAYMFAFYYCKNISWMGSKFLIYLGNASNYIFLLHNIICSFAIHFLVKLLPMDTNAGAMMLSIFMLFVGILAPVMLYWLVNRVSKTIKARKGIN